MESQDLLGMFAFALGLPAFLFLLFLIVGLCRAASTRGDVDEGQSFGGEYHD